jgi:hypothetical protein
MLFLPTLEELGAEIEVAVVEGRSDPAVRYRERKA